MDTVELDSILAKATVCSRRLLLHGSLALVFARKRMHICSVQKELPMLNSTSIAYQMKCKFLLSVTVKNFKLCDALKKLSQMALQQIMEKKYDAEMKARGIQDIYKYGVAFSGKMVEVAVL